MYGGFRVVIAVLGLAAAASAAAADPSKVLRIAFPVQETGFDPVRVSDLYSNTVNEAIFDRLLTYDYLARPAKVVPLAAESMPEISDNGRTYLFKIRRGIYFTPDAAFKGQKRELTAEDFVYTFKRFADPKNRSPWSFMIEGKTDGLDERNQDHTGGQSRLSRLRLGFRAHGRSARSGDREGNARQEDAADRPRRDQHHRGRPVALARFQSEGARLHRAPRHIPTAGF